MNNTQLQSSRKASEGRADRVSTASSDHGDAGAGGAAAAAKLITLGVAHARRAVHFCAMVDQLAMHATQSLNPEAFVKFLTRQKSLARRVVMVYGVGGHEQDKTRFKKELHDGNSSSSGREAAGHAGKSHDCIVHAGLPA